MNTVPNFQSSESMNVSFGGRRTSVRSSAAKLCCLLCLFVTAAIGKPAEAVELEFEYNPPFGDSTLVWMTRLPDGSFRCSVHSRRLNLSGPEPKWTRVKDVMVQAEKFARIEEAFEDSNLRRSAERGWPPAPDTSGWRLRKKVGARILEIRAFSPERDPAGGPIVRLAMDFESLAAMSIVSGGEKSERAGSVPGHR